MNTEPIQKGVDLLRLFCLFVIILKGGVCVCVFLRTVCDGQFKQVSVVPG